MPRDLPIGNGNFFISFDKDYQIREVNFPHIGEENHTKGTPFRFGVWVDNQFSWIPNGWNIKRDYIDDTLVTNVELSNPSLGLKIIANDVVDFHENIYLKRLLVENLSDRDREIRLFFTQDLPIYGNDIGNTAEFRPENHSLLHYKDKRHFLINIYAHNKYGIDSYATGIKRKGLYEGTWKDAEDGVLSNNPNAQGSVDSVLCMPLKMPKHGKMTCYYWIAAGTNWEEVKELNEIVKKRGPECFFTRTENYWKLWVNKDPLHPKTKLPPKIHWLYNRSLLIVRTLINNCGSIISADDSDVINFNRDTYSYVWPRDAAMIAHAMDLANYNLTVGFYNFCGRILEKGGYFLHKYTPSGLLASSWHPWIYENKIQLPIQEDETALVLWALWKHYEMFRDVEVIKPLYRTLIKKAADFMMNYRDQKTGLPLPSYDLWEERHGVLTFTVSTVYGGLIAASNFAEAFGEKELAEEYRKGAQQMKEATLKYLYLEKENRFARMIQFHKDGSTTIDATIDASLYGIFAFGMLSPFDEKVKSTMQQIEDKLLNKGGGIARYENDSYYRSSNEGPGNPWFITTLWLAQYYIAIARDKKELDKALDILSWVTAHALPSGVLAEQVNPKTHEPLSVSPLTWSHATFITTAELYLKALSTFDN